MKSILKWFDRHKRDLPWRLSKPDPYKTWISEMMLQQTQVDTVLPYYDRFLKRFPDVESLAAADVEEILKLWSGLGYYSRARNLHKAAQIIAEKGMFPSTRAGLLELPGIGEYSAGAIASIAFGERVPVVDGNVIRVLTRLFALKGDPKAKPLKEKLWKLAESLVLEASRESGVEGEAPVALPLEGATRAPINRPGDFNQAMMELGALVCTPKHPKCGVCPLKKECKAHRTKTADQYPSPRERAAAKKVILMAALIEKRGRYLLARRNGDKHLQSMWEFPQREPCHLGLDVKWKKKLPTVRHAIMNRNIRLTPHLYCYKSGEPKPGAQYVGFKWIELKELGHFPTSSLNKKIVKSL